MTQNTRRYAVGDKVDYHARIGGPTTSTGHVVRAVKLTPNNFGTDVAWLTDKSGCVAMAALTPTEENPDDTE